MVGVKDTLFVLDNNIYGDGEGVIRVFNVLDDENEFTIKSRETISQHTFGSDMALTITDFQILNATDLYSSNLFVISMTIREVGFGYANFPTPTPITGKLINLK